MSILIKGVEMPVNCAGCPCANDESRYCHAAKKYIPMLSRPDFCPLAEVEERKRGKWIFIGNQMFECSECGTCYTQSQFHQMRVRISDPEFPKFCPNCGTYMRKGEGEKE